jgi:ligand-binding sensor domain-containing protein/signal transduction histidine kinase
MSKILKILMLAVLIGNIHPAAYSLDPKKALRQYIHESYNTDNGLPQSSVSSIIQSRDGYIWFATQEGVVRFDGLRMTIIDRNNTPELASNNIGGLMEDRNGGIWMFPAGRSGVTRFKDGKFRTFTTKDGLASLARNAAAMDSSGNLWITSNNGVSKLDGDKFITFTRKDGLPSDSAFTIYCDPEGSIWMATYFNMTRYKDGRFTTYSREEGLLTDSVTAFCSDHDRNMWIGTFHGLNKMTDGKFSAYTKKDGLADNLINAIFEDSRKQLWIGTEKGLDKFENGAFIHIQSDDGVSSTPIAGIIEDKEGTVWIRPRNKGIQRLHNGTLETYSTKDGLSENDVRKIFEDREGSLWIGIYGSGVDRLRDTKFTTYTTEDGLSQDLIQSVFEDHEQNFWVGTFTGGLNKLSGGKWRHYSTKDGLASNAISGIAEDHSGVIWISSALGLNQIKNGKILPVTLPGDMSANGVNALLVDHQGSVWIGGSKIARYDGGNLVTIRDTPGLNFFSFVFYEDQNGIIWAGSTLGLYRIENDRAVNIPLPDSLPFSGIFEIQGDRDGTLWLGSTGGGIIRYKDGKFKAITPKDGLFDYNSYCLLEDEYGNFWTDCNKGIYRVSKKELNEFCDGKRTSVTCTVFGTADGMKNRECNGGSSPNAWRMHDGKLCFSTVKGVAMIYPADIKLNMVPPPIVIEQMLVDQKPSDLRIKNIYSPGTEKFEFHYAGISFLGADKVRFKYKLEPFETEWIDAGSRRDAFYTHIPPGDYTFKVIAANSDGVWNETGPTVAFTLKPFFYQSGWFLALCVVGFVGVGPGLYLMRVRQLKRRETELTSIVDARTRDLKKEKENVEKALTDLKEAQNQLVLSEKMASLGQLTAGIAHEIKNPLNFVNNFASLSNDLMNELKETLATKSDVLDEDTKTTIRELLSDLQQNVTKINEHGKRADSIVRGMLLHSRGKTGERQPTDLNALLAEYTNLAYHGLRAQDSSFNIKIETQFDDTIGKVNVVPQDLSRVFLNIINNGCYSANDKKKSRPNGFAPTIRVSSKNLGDKFEVRIWDNGNGIPQSVLDKIFNPFFTTKPAGAGTGLGLSMSYDIITQEHKGEINVDTKDGEFAEFIITIPKNAG